MGFLGRRALKKRRRPAFHERKESETANSIVKGEPQTTTEKEGGVEHRKSSSVGAGKVSTSIGWGVRKKNKTGTKKGFFNDWLVMWSNGWGVKEKGLGVQALRGLPGGRKGRQGKIRLKKKKGRVQGLDCRRNGFLSSWENKRIAWGVLKVARGKTEEKMGTFGRKDGGMGQPWGKSRRISEGSWWLSAAGGGPSRQWFKRVNSARGHKDESAEHPHNCECGKQKQMGKRKILVKKVPETTDKPGGWC